MAEWAAPADHHAAASMPGRMLAGLVGICCAALASWLALHHPLSPAMAMVGVGLLAAAQAAWPPLWLIALPALLPWVGLGAWTGWLVVEEMDLAILAVAAGGYLRWALRPGPRLPAGRSSRQVRAWSWLLWLIWSTSVLWAAARGVHDAGGWALGWWQGYREPMNALRLAKPTLLALLLLPLWWRVQQRPDQRCAEQLSWGLALALAGTALWCVWERVLFTGLLNMSSDYRTTGPFWETQFGGAALDIWLALTMPFAFHLAWRATTSAAMAGAWMVLLIGGYAALTSFSRIVYLALPAAAAVQCWLEFRRDRAAQAGLASGHGLVPAMALCAGIAALGVAIFHGAGYRGLLALLGNAVLLLLLLARSTPPPWSVGVGAVLLGLVLGLVLLMAAQLSDKGPYIAYAVVTGLGALALSLPDARARVLLGGAGLVAQLCCTLLVAMHWGGGSASPAAAVAALALACCALVWGSVDRKPWQRSPRWLGGTSAGMVLVLAVVAVFGGGEFMVSRLGQSESDRASRWQHWRDSVALVGQGPNFWLGQGLGRYAELYALTIPAEGRPGDIRFVTTEGETAVRMVAGNHTLGHGELLRLSQRVAPPPARGLTVTVQLRAAGPVSVQVELCEKHLLYDQACRIGSGRTRDGAGGWQTLKIPLPDRKDSPSGGLLGPMTVFSVASNSARQPLDLREVALTDASGHPWLHNAGFAEGGARWFATSDRNHLPWHAKNLAVHLLVEQGLFGLVAMVALTVVALAAAIGPQRRHVLSPPLVAAILGCWVVGGVDSVLDMPRVATWLLLLIGMALSLHLPSRGGLRGQASA